MKLKIQIDKLSVPEEDVAINNAIQFELEEWAQNMEILWL